MAEAKKARASELVKLFNQAIAEKWGYIYGAAGETWTQAKQNADTREQTQKWGSRWIGRRVADCSGLFSWAYKQLGSQMYHGSNTMIKKWSTDKGELVNGKRKDGKPLQIGCAVYKYNKTDEWHHVGMYVGGGKVIEAKGTYYGVVKSDIKEWHWWSELTNTNYDIDPETGKIDPVTPEPEKKEEKLMGTCVVSNATGTVNVRKGPSTSTKVLTSLPVGSEISVTEDDGTWCKVQIVTEGYMMRKYLEQKK